MTWLLNHDGDELINLDHVRIVSTSKDGTGLMVGSRRVAHGGYTDQAETNINDLFWAVCKQIRDGADLIDVPALYTEVQS